MSREANMLRTTLLTFAGALAGIALVVVILLLTNVVLRWMTSPRIFEIEHSTLYLTVVLGAGFGAVCGAVIGAVGAIVRALCERSGSGAA
jgi:hypothetical protein